MGRSEGRRKELLTAENTRFKEGRPWSQTRTLLLVIPRIQNDFSCPPIQDSEPPNQLFLPLTSLLTEHGIAWVLERGSIVDFVHGEPAREQPVDGGVTCPTEERLEMIHPKWDVLIVVPVLKLFEGGEGPRVRYHGEESWRHCGGWLARGGMAEG